MPPADPYRQVLVTGATGFLARYLFPALPRSLALVRTQAAWDALPHRREMGNEVPIVGDLENPSAWSRFPTAAGTIVHLAALVRHSRQDAEAVYRTNVEGTLAMVRLAAKIGARLIFVSTSGTVGCFSSPKETADEGAPYCGDVIHKWPYYDSKMQAEIKARQLANQLGVELVIVRLPVLLGPGDHRGRSTALVARLAAGRQFFVMDGGIAFTDVRDVAQGLAAIVAVPSPRRIYHLAGTSCSLAEFFRQCAELAGVAPPRLCLPKAVVIPLAHVTNSIARVFGTKSPLPSPVVVEMGSHYWGFTSRWSHELGYSPRSACETLGDTIAWLQGTGSSYGS
jgi:dihydroflavonol-4-reductase